MGASLVQSVSCRSVSLTDLYDNNLPLFTLVYINMLLTSVKILLTKILWYYKILLTKPVYVMKWCTPNPYTDKIKHSITELWFVFIDRSLKRISSKNIKQFVIQLQDDKNVAKVMSMSDITISVVILVFLTHGMITQGIHFCIKKRL